jgi:GTPase SAR1 family protein
MTQLNDHANSEELAKLLVGNKCDLEASREVTKEKAEMFCAEFGMEHLETSAKSGENVLKAFERLITIVHERSLATGKSKTGIKGMNGSDNASSGANGQGGFKLDEGNARGEGASSVAEGSGACGC